MSSHDLWIRDILTSYKVLTVLLLLSMVLWIIRKWPKIRKNIYKSYLTGFEVQCAELALPYKDHLFESLHRIVSKDEVLRSMDCIRILEIGVKTGENLQFYPDGTRLISVDWNLRLGEYLVKGNRSWQFSHVIIERLINGDGSSMKDVPSGCVDVVVTTRSLCSVSSVRSTLREIRRVLAPDGQYLFMEHVPANKGTFVWWLQKGLSRTRIWPSLFGGCRLDANPIAEIESTFDRVTWAPITLEGSVSQPHHLALSRQHVLGIAVR